MRTDRWLSQTAWCLSFLLSQASVLLGLAFTVGWTLAFTLLLPSRAVGWATRPEVMLPIQPPLIGLVLGGLGLLIARFGEQKIAGYAVAGLVFNAVPLVLALTLIVFRAGR